jgi:hypothetical protein
VIGIRYVQGWRTYYEKNIREAIEGNKVSARAREQDVSLKAVQDGELSELIAMNARETEVM